MRLVGLDDGGFDAAEMDRDLIAERLQQDVVSSLPTSSPALPLTQILAGTHWKATSQSS